MPKPKNTSLTLRKNYRNRWVVTVPPSWNGKRERHSFESEGAAEIWMAERTLEKVKNLEVKTSAREGDLQGTVEKAALAYLKDREGEVTKEPLRLMTNHLQKLVDEFGHMGIDEPDPLVCRNWIRRIKYSQRTKHGIYSTCRTFYRWALRYGYAKTSPFDRMEPIPKGEAPKGILTPAQMRKGLEFAKDFMHDFFVLGGFCGLRPIEIMRLDWKAFNFDTRQIYIGPDVTKRDNIRGRGTKHRYVDIPETAMRLLPRDKKEGKVIPRHYDAVRRRMVRIWKNMGLSEWPHDALRHSAATYLLAVTQNANRVAHWLGHTTTQMVSDSYGKAVPNEVAHEWWSIGIEFPADSEPKIIDLFADSTVMVPYRLAA